ncbi:uroporphyrinogen-III synthase [Sporolactobacillus sp. Y61]|uniref:Uroporphyrinogen-III synthase n=1 Tax=Sporolactobacillus sp. Y61 TaxID=3160863 RepID=A0AAU8IEB2_9BACL|nr:uroporphyrinogen-III synthase [Sporolactobacillus sp. THM19-2]
MIQVLKGKRVLITRSAGQASEMIARVQDYGGEAVTVPLMSYRFVPVPRDERTRWLDHVSRADLIILTSGNSVDFFMRTLDTPARIRGKRLAAVGRKTARKLADAGLKNVYVPEKYTGKALGKALLTGTLHAERIVFPHGSLTDPSWIHDLKSHGFNVTERTLYETVPDLSQKERLAEIMRSGEMDALTFASPSAVRFFTEMLNEETWKKALTASVVGAIGPSTAQSLDALGFAADVIPKYFTSVDLIDALANFYNKRKKSST